MVVLLVVNLSASLVMAGLAAVCALEMTSDFYPTTIPMMVQPGVTAALAALGLALRRGRFPLLMVTSLLLMTLGGAFVYGGTGFPGGDDGGGFAWIFLVGGGTVVSFFLALLTGLIGIVYRAQASPAAQARPVHAAAQADRQSIPVAAPVKRKVSRLIRPLWGMLGVVLLLLVWVVIGAIPWSEETVAYRRDGLVIRHTIRHELLPYPYPFYHHERVRRQTVFVDGRKWFQAGQLDDLYPSPGGEYVAVQVWEEPIEVWRKGSSTPLSLEVDDSKEGFPSHDYTYPFRFLRWEDGDSFLVEVTGSDENFEKYRQVWRVDAATGERELIEETTE